MIVYVLSAENIEAAGGPMDRQDDCYTMWSKTFKEKQTAKNYAQKSHNKSRRKEILKWHKSGNQIDSQDCGWVMYHINIVKVIE